MSSYSIIYEVSKFLQETLWAGFDGDSTVTQFVGTQASIVLMNPAETAANTDRRLSLWLYQVTPNEFLQNRPALRPQPRGGARSDDDTIQYPPLALNLFYLLTPSTAHPDGDQIVLGRSMQILNDNAVLLLQSAEEPGTAEELHISLCQRSLQELAEVWEALQQPYRLSLCYEVRSVRIDSLRKERAGRVSQRSLALHDNPVGASV